MHCLGLVSACFIFEVAFFYCKKEGLLVLSQILDGLDVLLANMQPMSVLSVQGDIL
jgi:hypothetical protein